MRSVLQDWVMERGLRFQGTLLGVMRGCDLVPKEHVSKKLTRAFRCECLTSAHVRGPVTETSPKPMAYIEWFSNHQLAAIMRDFCSDLDQYPLHYVLHVAHAAEVIGYCLPDLERRRVWFTFYATLCRKFHVIPETEEQLHGRLGADESEFAKAQVG